VTGRVAARSSTHACAGRAQDRVGRRRAHERHPGTRAVGSTARLEPVRRSYGSAPGPGAAGAAFCSRVGAVGAEILASAGVSTNITTPIVRLHTTTAPINAGSLWRPSGRCTALF